MYALQEVTREQRNSRLAEAQQRRHAVRARALNRARRRAARAERRMSRARVEVGRLRRELEAQA